MSDFTVEVQHSPDTILALSKVIYSIQNTKKRAVMVISAIVCLLLGSRLIGNIAEPFNYLFSLYGCFSLVFMNFPAKYRGETIINNLRKGNKPFPCSVFQFQKDCFTVNTKNYESNKEKYQYKDCHRLIIGKDALYYFLNREAAFIFPISCLPEGQVEAFKTYLEEKTGLRFTVMNHWWNATLKSLFNRKKNMH